MKKEKPICIIIALIVIAPFAFVFYFLPLLLKAVIRYILNFIRYILNKDNGLYTFSNCLTDVRRESKLFNKRWREMKSKGTYVD